MNGTLQGENTLIGTLSSGGNVTGGLGTVIGRDGKSAYEIWLDEGNEGTEADFLASLKGEKGDPGGGGVEFETGVGLKLEDNVLSVDSAKDFSGDNTRPAEAAMVQEIVGNIEILLQTI